MDIFIYLFSYKVTSGSYQLYSGGLLLADTTILLQPSTEQTILLLNTLFETESQIDGLNILATQSGCLNVSVKKPQ